MISCLEEAYTLRDKEEVGLSLLPSALCRLPQGRSPGHD